MRTILLLGAAGCTTAYPALTAPRGDPATPGGAASGVPVETVGAPGAPRGAVVESAEGSLADPTDLVFDQGWVHQVDITLPQPSVDALLGSPWDYAIGDVSYDGIALPGVGVRIKGKIGSYRDLYHKSAFKIDFGQFGATGTLYGLQQLTLNNNVADCSMMKTPIGYHVFALAGAKVPRIGFAWVRVNGQPYGLYTVVETPDDQWLQRSYADPTGNLYDGKYIFDPATWSYTLLDFTHAVDGLYQLEEGDDVGHADIYGITDALWATWGSPDFLAATGEVVDWDRLHPYLAAEQMMGHVDGYALNQNNYRVYFDPANDGRAELVPWDLDNTMIDDFWWGMSWATPRGYLASACWSDPTCYAEQRAAMGELVDDMAPVDWDEEIDRIDALTLQYALQDPRKECTDVTGGRAALRGWMDGRPGAMRAFWGL